MNPSNQFSIKATIEFLFNDPQTRDFSYNSFLPELKQLNTNRSKITIEKKKDSLFYYIESSDITAFRASISEIIGLGKIIEGTLKLSQ